MPASLAPPRRVVFLLFIASCCGGDSCCGPSDGCDSKSECWSDADCSGGLHCEIGIFGNRCVSGCISDTECATGTHCQTPLLLNVGTCVSGCIGDSECSKDEFCNRSFFDDVGVCKEREGKGGAAGKAGSGGQGGKAGSGGKAGAGGKAGQAGQAGQAGTSGAAGLGGGSGQGPSVVVTIDGCSLLDDDSCQASVAGLVCCRVLGYRYDEAGQCFIEGGLPPSALWCLPQVSDDGECSFLTQPACYERSLEGGSREIVLATPGLPPETLPSSIDFCSQPVNTNACSGGSAGASGSAGAGPGGAQGGSGGSAGGQGGG